MTNKKHKNKQTKNTTNKQNKKTTNNNKTTQISNILLDNTV